MYSGLLNRHFPYASSLFGPGHTGITSIQIPSTPIATPMVWPRRHGVSPNPDEDSDRGDEDRRPSVSSTLIKSRLVVRAVMVRRRHARDQFVGATPRANSVSLAPLSLGSKLFTSRHRPDEFLHQFIHPFANRFVTCREILAQRRDIVPTDQPPARPWQCGQITPMEMTTSAEANSSDPILRGFSMGTE
jgi:hypothetical protein